ncbi:MAG: ABC transporter ATP-binding protein [Geodermatophilaceae bacterium]|nr:ABC transporter ATP-binding protein [Geodermatophilaceae bacterium]
MTALLEVEDLRVSYGDVAALRGLSFALDRGESIAVAGESGSGKSTLALCLAGLVQPPQASGRVLLNGEDLIGADPERLSTLRWATVALALQGAPLNPVTRVGVQLAEPLRQRTGMSRRDAVARVAELADEVLLDGQLLERYPHQLSGGQRRLALLAGVLTLDPELVILDEPTAGLDPITRRDLLEQIRRLATARGFALVMMSHDLPEASRLASTMMLLYAGEVVEIGSASRVTSRPAHPYSWALVNAQPVMSSTKDLRPIRGLPPDPRAVPAGCAYHPRCTQAEDICRGDRPVLVSSRGRRVRCHFGGLKTLLSATGLHKSFGTGSRRVSALRGVSFTLLEGESVGVIGPSGSGKSTLARILSGQLAADAGQVVLEGVPLEASWRQHERMLRRRVQLVMQDPWDALSPRLPVEDLVAEPLVILGGSSASQRRHSVGELLDSVGLPAHGGFLRARTHELSGGQLQRIALARALAAEPKLLVADEPTSMLDASEQARMLVVLRERQIEMGLGLVLISHDVAVVRKVTDRIVVLDEGLVVEEGPSALVSSLPQSGTAQRLVLEAPSWGEFDVGEHTTYDTLTEGAP